MTMNIKKVGLIIILFSLIIVLTSLFWVNKYWPFSSGSDIPFLLGTTYNMSEPEVHRALKKYDAKLVDFHKFDKLMTNKNRKNPFLWTIYVVPEDDVKNEYLYMPEISMFDSLVVAKFSLINGKLDSVNAVFLPYTLSKAPEVVNDVILQLEKIHKLLEKKPSLEIPDAYHVTFIGEGAKVTLWVNLTETSKPIIHFYVCKNITKSDAQNELDLRKGRNEAAFGVEIRK